MTDHIAGLKRIAVDALYDARNDGLVMDDAAGAVVDAVLQELQDNFVMRYSLFGPDEELQDMLANQSVLFTSVDGEPRQIAAIRDFRTRASMGSVPLVVAVDRVRAAIDRIKTTFKTYEITVYEPAVDPGGYYDTYKIKAASEKVAINRAMDLANTEFPDSKGMEIYEIKVVDDEE